MGTEVNSDFREDKDKLVDRQQARNAIAGQLEVSGLLWRMLSDGATRLLCLTWTASSTRRCGTAVQDHR